MKILQTLSSKKNSVVNLVKIDEKEYVVKYYQVPSRSMLVEIDIMTNIRHPNIISMKYLLTSSADISVGILMEKEEINFIDIIGNEKISNHQYLNYLIQIISGIEYLHQNLIVHMDMKSENIMITNDKCKIIDFGSSEIMINGKISTNQIKCTVTHRPPEAFEPINTLFDTSFDIWSLGIIFFEIFSRMPMYKHPLTPKYDKYDDLYDVKMYNYVTSEKFLKEIEKILPISFAKCLMANPNYRPCIKNIKLFLNDLNE